jgi:hypothetical protein
MNVLICEYIVALTGIAALAEANLRFLSQITNRIPEKTPHRLQVRQSIPSDCNTVCDWLFLKAVACETAGSPDASDACVCLAIEAGGSLLNSCAECIAPINASLASALTIEAAAACSQPGSPTLACSGPCSSLRMAFETCYSNAECVCPFLLADGPACSECFATDAAESTNFVQAISFCASGLSTTPSQLTGVTSAPVKSPHINYCLLEELEPSLNQQSDTCDNGKCWKRANIKEFGAH